ncbi:MAG TPA: hypothetical protein VIK72_15170 [Clostridiaceae bacterium]
MEGNVFRTMIPLKPQAGEQASEQGEDSTRKILEFCKTVRSRSEIQDFSGIKSRRYFIEKILNPLLKGGLLKLSIPNKPTTPNQKYYNDKMGR